MPQVLTRLLDLCHTDDFNVAQLAELIANDAGMTAKVLRVATSPVYSRSPHLPNLQKALITIGTDMVKKLLITESIHQTIKQLPAASATDLSRFWADSIATALASQMLAQKSGYPNVDEAYLAGLFRNIGRLLLVSAFPGKYRIFFNQPDTASLLAAEHEALQCTHVEAGAWLIAKWQLDSFIADSVMFHHEALSQLETAHPLVKVVAIAGHLIDRSFGPDDAPLLQKWTGLVESDLELMRERIFAERSKIATQLGIDLTLLKIDENLSANRNLIDQVEPAEVLRHTAIDHALVSSVTESLASEEDTNSCVRAIIGSAIILFDVTDGLVLSRDQARNALVPVGIGEGRRRLLGMEIPLADNHGLAGAFKESGTTFITDSQDAAVGLKQLLTLFKTDCLMLIPMRDEGMLIFGIRTTQIAALTTRKGMLPHFASQVKYALEKMRNKDVEKIDALASQFKLDVHRFAHEVNTPLAIIKNYLAVLDRKLGTDSARGDLTLLNEEIDRVSSLVRELTDFERTTRTANCMLHAELRRSADIWAAGGLMDVGINVNVTVEPPDVHVAISADTLRQIILNLLKNAAEALPVGGHVQISQRETVNRNGRFYTEVLVADNGPGIPPSLFKRLFSPGATSKSGVHRGLGLNIVQGLIQKAGGEIDCRTDQTGTRFTLLLPLAQGQEGAAQDLRSINAQ